MHLVVYNVIIITITMDVLIMSVANDIHSEGIPVKPQTLPASLVLSSQIAGYSGGEVDSNATVDITFPIKVCI